MRISDWSSDVCSSDLEPIGGQRIAAVIVGLGVLALPLLALWSTDGEATGARAAEGSINAISGDANDVTSLRRSLFTDYLFAFEITSVLLVIAAIGAVVMARRVKASGLVEDPLVAAAEAERARSEERSVGKECGSTVRHRGSTYH